MSTLDEMFGLSGRVALVTGASAGLGKEMAAALAGAGADVALLARRKDKLEDTAAALKRDYGVRSVAVAVDLNDREALSRAFTDVTTELGEIDVLVNNAGVAPTGRAENQWPQDWDATVSLNLSAVFHCCLLARESMARGERGGRIINISSIFGRLGSSLFRLSAYAAAKGGVDNLTRQLAVEWAKEGITVNAIAPAWFRSEMTEGSLARDGIEETMASAAPIGRIGRPGELDSACLFLAAPASSYVTGAVIPVDGGYSVW